MKSPFRLSKTNLIYAAITSILMILIKIRIYGTGEYIFAHILGSLIPLLGVPTFFALVFWLMLGSKKKGGTTTFNVILTLLLLSTLSGTSKKLAERRKPIEDLKQAIEAYHESLKTNPDSVNLNYAKLTENIRQSLDGLIETSVGEEKKLFLALKPFLEKSNKVNLQWTKAFDAFNQPRILDFDKLNNKDEFEFQKQVAQNHINQSKNMKAFSETKVDYFNSQARDVDKNTKIYKEFMASFILKDSTQNQTFIPYINAHIAYGEDVKKIINILEKEQGRWDYEEKTLIIQDLATQKTIDELINNIFLNEKIINERFEVLNQ